MLRFPTDNGHKETGEFDQPGSHMPFARQGGCMTSAVFLFILVLAVAALMLLIIRIKMHPALAIFIVTFFLGLALGKTPSEAINIINTNFGGTLAGIGIVIILGSVIAMGIQDTGAANSISDFFHRLLKGRNVELGPSLAGFVLSIPVFGDITMILLAPIAHTMATIQKLSMSTMACFINLGLFMTHSMVPPTPGILAITLQLGADLGMVIIWGIAISLTAFLLTWLLLRKWVAKEYIPPSEEYARAGKTESGSGQAELEVWKAFLPLLLPVVLISAASVCNGLLPGDNGLRVTMNFFGDRVVALFIGVLCAIYVANSRMALIRSDILAMDPQTSPTASVVEMLTNSWVKRALIVAIVPLIITGMGGAFGGMLKTSEAAKDMATLLARSELLPVVVPWLIGFLMFLSVGSVTMAQLTAAALVQPILPELGLSPLVAVLATGAGAMGPNHVNNSGFWVMCGFYNLSARQGLKYLTIPCTIASVLALIIMLVLVYLGILA
jgi:GntP family gluconate:H+ symporter